MKFKKMILVVSLTLMLFLQGCVSTDSVSTNVPTTNRFIVTNDTYAIGSRSYTVVYDSKTKIVYLRAYSGYHESLEVFYGEDKLPMTIDEYNETK